MGELLYKIMTEIFRKFDPNHFLDNHLGDSRINPIEPTTSTDNQPRKKPPEERVEDVVELSDVAKEASRE